MISKVKSGSFGAISNRKVAPSERSSMYRSVSNGLSMRPVLGCGIGVCCWAPAPEVWCVKSKTARVSTIAGQCFSITTFQHGNYYSKSRPVARFPRCACIPRSLAHRVSESFCLVAESRRPHLWPEIHSCYAHADGARIENRFLGTERDFHSVRARGKKASGGRDEMVRGRGAGRRIAEIGRLLAHGFCKANSEAQAVAGHRVGALQAGNGRQVARKAGQLSGDESTVFGEY